MLGAKRFTSFFLFLLLPLNNFVVGTEHLAWVQTITSPPPPYPVHHRCSLKRETYLHCYEKLFRSYVPQVWLFKTSINFNKISVEVQRLPASALVVFVTVERSFVTESENKFKSTETLWWLIYVQFLNCCCGRLEEPAILISGLLRKAQH